LGAATEAFLTLRIHGGYGEVKTRSSETIVIEGQYFRLPSFRIFQQWRLSFFTSVMA
jgi:hypothetical protein